MGTYHTIKATLPHIRKSRGAYLHVSATLHYKGLPYQAHVSAAKAGVDALSGVLAVEEGPRGIRSNVIAPGPVLGTAGMERLSAQDDDMKKKQTGADIPLQRASYIEEIASAAVFLFSDAATMITGTILVMDGGAVHTQQPVLPYPSSVLDPETTKKLIKARM